MFPGSPISNALYLPLVVSQQHRDRSVSVSVCVCFSSSSSGYPTQRQRPPHFKGPPRSVSSRLTPPFTPRATIKIC